ncbi:MAG: metal ABC transporter permease [Bacteroidales bacterium]|nr:metal ABC transporter permease [Bacteroidales bacterium]
MRLPPVPFLSAYASDTAYVMMVVATACAVPGVFLVLRRVTMVSDAISHVLLFGIVSAFLLTHDLNAPALLIGAAGSGVIAVALVELLQRSRLVKADAAIGLTFPVLFSLGVILASLYTRNTHLDVDQVLLGHAEYASLDRLHIGALDLPRSLVIVGTLFLVHGGLVVVFYKELQLSTFDVALAASLGFWPGLLHYGLMTMVSFTAVAAFDAVGPVLVVAFFTVPASAAYLLTNRLHHMLWVSVGIGAGSALLGVLVAFGLDTTIAGTTATVLGIVFGMVFVFAPNRGCVARALRRWQRRREFFETMLTIHLFQHEGTPSEVEEARYDGLHRHLRWHPEDVRRVVHRAQRHELISQEGALLKLSEKGRERARTVLHA